MLVTSTSALAKTNYSVQYHIRRLCAATPLPPRRSHFSPFPMKEQVPFLLPEQTTRLLSRQPPDSTACATIHADRVCVALSTTQSLPAGLVLPAGLQLNRTSVKLHDVAASEPSSSTPTLVALQYVAAVCFNITDLQSFTKSIAHSDLITVNGQPLQHDTLEQTLPNLPDHQVVLLNVYDSGRNPASEEGPVYNSVTSRQKFVTINLDCLIYCSPSSTRQQILDLVATSANHVLSESLSIANDGQVSITHHRVLGADLAVTFISPLHEDEQSAESVARRRCVHEALLLPTDRPLFRRSCSAFGAASTFTDGGWPGRLANVHHGIKSHGLGTEGVSVHMVQGKYLYCHYLQDKFNDAKWGCAYRSLQTILSWCALEQYVQFEDGNIPSHSQIQQALVDVGDKKSQFVGSKEWIGANEVCYALEKLTGVTSKILHVSRGADMDSKGRELALHFDTQGSPVMVGGGVLAWTILGVARDARTGDTKFLILDPHYEGRDDLAVIQKKKWVAWKGGDVFVQDAFYNLCMPQRPKTV